MSDAGVIIVTGASGACGPGIVRHLRADGWTVVEVQRRAEDSPEQIRADLGAEDQTQLLERARELAGQVKGVVHCAGVVDERQGGHTIIETNLRIAHGVARLCEATACDTLVNLSSVAVYGRPTRAVRYRDDGAAEPASMYGVSKLAVEGYLRLAAGADQRVCHLRLGYVLAPRAKTGTAVVRMARALRAGEEVELTAPLSNRFQFIDIRDIAATASSAVRGRVEGVFNLVHPRPVPLGEVHTALVASVGGRAAAATVRTRDGADILRAEYDMERHAAAFPEIALNEPLEAIREYAAHWV